MRVGMGYDVHKLVENRKLILGGVAIPYEYGLLGHSDADVLVHAIMDAMVKNVAEALHLEEDQVNIKATTEEGLGFTGKKEGISAQAICCISKALDLMPDDRIAGGCSGCPGCAKNAEE